MKHQEYTVKRKLQEQSGSYLVTLPKLWIEAMGLKEGDIMTVKFNGSVHIQPLKNSELKVNEK
jgi:bifunctional DNA-binding transcriptional regulator/antitoxin component of YhaV-PrlF toxin-antitoxin module